MKKELLKLNPREFCDKTRACDDGVKYALNHQTMAAVWDNCQRVDWLVWILNAINAPQDEKACRLYMVWCAKNTPLPNGGTTLSLLTDKRSIKALEVAESFAHGLTDVDSLSAAESAALSAAELAARSAAWSAAESAAWSAALSAAWSAAESAAWSAALSAAESAAELAARSAAWSAARSAQANQFRKVVRNPFKEYSS